MISLIDAFAGCEDRIGTMLRNVFETTNINLIGGSAGNLSKVKEAYVAVNGELADNACALLLVSTNKKIFTCNENIYKPIGDMYRVTKADFETRTIYEANNKPFVDLYCNNIGVEKSQLNLLVFSKKPIGRVQGDKTYISSPLGANDELNRLVKGFGENANSLADICEMHVQETSNIYEILNLSKQLESIKAKDLEQLK